MCKVFKIKTKTGLVTTTTDQSIVKCLMDNYDDELTVTISKENKPIEIDETQLEDETEKIDVLNVIQFNLRPYFGIDKFGYVKELKDLLQISLSKAKQLANDGGIVYRTYPYDIQSFETLLDQYKVPYTEYKLNGYA